VNGHERIKAAVGFEKPDRVPVVAQVFGHAATLAGVRLDDYVRDGELLARCQLKALDRYGYDAVFALMDVSVETEALGSVLEYHADSYPTIRDYVLADASGAEGLAVPDPAVAGRMPELLKAVRILRGELGDDILVVGAVLGPMTLVIQMLGAERALYVAADDPERFGALLDFAAAVVTRYGEAQLEAGAHLVVVFDPSSSPAVVPAAFFRELVLPHLARVFAAFKQGGSEASWLHIAGPADAILPLYPGAGVDLANVDYCVDVARAAAALPHTCLDGALKPLSFVDDSPDVITAGSLALIDQFAARGGFILSSGCEIPLESRPENILAMVSAARER
jgi:uroporphyrinogen decarboxylase